MKIFISSDIEGTTGIANWDETELTSVEGEFFRKQMAKEVNAACVGANKLGCSEIFIKDAHGSGRTIDPSLLPENIKIMRDWARNPLIMMAGIDETFDACLFTGYHSGSSQNGNPLSHTMHCDYDYIKINGKVATEFMINAYTAAMFNVPDISTLSQTIFSFIPPFIIPRDNTAEFVGAIFLLTIVCRAVII